MRASPPVPADAGTTTVAAHPVRGGRRGLLVALFLVYLALLAWVVLWKLEAPHVGGLPRSVKLVPFAPSGDAGASSPAEVAANVLLFVPFGLYLGLLAPRWPVRGRVAVLAGASLTLEVAQYVLAIGASDVTDLVANTAGGLAGLGLLALLRSRLRERTGLVMARACAIGTALAVVATGLFAASPAGFTQRDVRVARVSAPGLGTGADGGHDAAPGATGGVGGAAGAEADPGSDAGAVGGVAEADGALPFGATAFDDGYPGVANLDPALLLALRAAATGASADGVELVVTSGWRSPEYQDRLLREAIVAYGSAEEAARWVATADASPHVSGSAVDVGTAGAAWLSEHGAGYGLCQIYGNEPWHYELRAGAAEQGCPGMYADPAQDPRMRR
jgi:glycopeptide antibiotics resistance protein